MSTPEKNPKDNSEQSNGQLENQGYIRKRTRASAEQLSILEDTFSVNVSPNSKLRKNLAQNLNMTERSIQIWFQNRRAKVKHMKKRAQMQMQQAAIRAQLYYYHQQQQQYGMIPQYETAPPIMPTPSIPYYNHQQPFYFPPSQSPAVPLPRAQSVDAISHYNSYSLNYNTKYSIPTSDFSSVIDMPRQNYSLSFDENLSASPNSAFMESPLTISRQSMPPCEGFSPQTIVDSNMTPSCTEFEAYLDMKKQTAVDDIPLNCAEGQMSLSPNIIEEVCYDSSSSSISQIPSLRRKASGTIISSITSETQESDLISEKAEFNSDKDILSSSPDFNGQSESIDSHFSKDNFSLTTINPVNLAKIGSEVENQINRKLFDANTLTIGSWHRAKVCTSDLICTYNSDENVFEWYITERDCRFKIVVLRSNISEIEFCSQNTDSSTGEIHFYLSHPPLFYMEIVTNITDSRWTQCSDFTENEQASRFLRHTWKGGAYQLKQDLNYLIDHHQHFKDISHFLDSNSQQQYTTVASNGPFISHQQQKNLTITPAALYNSYYGCFTHPSQIPLSSNSNGSFCSSNSTPSSVMFIPNKVTCNDFYS